MKQQRRRRPAARPLRRRSRSRLTPRPPSRPSHRARPRPRPINPRAACTSARVPPATFAGPVAPRWAAKRLSAGSSAAAIAAHGAKSTGGGGGSDASVRIRQHTVASLRVPSLTVSSPRFSLTHALATPTQRDASVLAGRASSVSINRRSSPPARARSPCSHARQPSQYTGRLLIGVRNSGRVSGASARFRRCSALRRRRPSAAIARRGLSWRLLVGVLGVGDFGAGTRDREALRVWSREAGCGLASTRRRDARSRHEPAGCSPQDS